ncbi:hypothetical protein SDC9_180456 [bioreactor metagenome]|uniref:Uncharacterized protein n=1 Tax=bioreactor metagenome TaxID=1076179 RepID=A0A645HB04_9ZZZZ
MCVENRFCEWSQLFNKNRGDEHILCKVPVDDIEMVHISVIIHLLNLMLYIHEIHSHERRYEFLFHEKLQTTE